MKKKMIDEINYLTRLGDIYLFAENILGLGLTRQNSLAMVSRLSSGIKEMGMDKTLWKGVQSEEEMEKIASKIEKAITKSNSAKVNNYKKWVLNYSLVMLCSVFDSFEEDLLELTLGRNPQLCTWNTRDEIIGRFRYDNPSNRLKVFTNKLGFTEEELFGFSGFKDEVKRKFYNFNTKDFISIYKKRDKAAHADSYVLNTLDDLLYVKDLFDKLVWRWMIIFRKKWRIKSKMVELYNSSNQKVSKNGK